MSIPTSTTTSTSILERLIEPEDGSFSEEHARYVLSLKFTEKEQAYCEELSYKAQEGTLTSKERDDLDQFLRANSLLILLKSKARRSLERHASAA